MNSLKNNRLAWTVALAGAAAVVGGASGGALGGAGIHRDRVLAYATDVYEIAFRSGESARIAVAGDGDTDLDLLVYDSAGNLVVSDMDGTDRCVAEWVPDWSQVYTVQIRNYGSVYNEYVIGHN